MDKVLMFTANIGLMAGIIGLFAFLCCCIAICYDNFTSTGRFAIALLKIQGKRRIYPLKKWFIVMVLGLGWYFTWRYG